MKTKIKFFDFNLSNKFNNMNWLDILPDMYDLFTSLERSNLPYINIKISHKEINEIRITKLSYEETAKTEMQYKLETFTNENVQESKKFIEPPDLNEILYDYTDCIWGVEIINNLK